MKPAGASRLSVAVLLLLAGMVTLHTSPCNAQGSAVLKPQLGQSAGQAGIRHYSPGSWGIVAFEVFNPSDKPAEVLIVAYFVGDPNLQYGRRLWVPARSKRTSWYSILPPAGNPPANGSLELKTLLLEKSGNTETVLKAVDGRMLGTGRLRAGKEVRVTGFLAKGDYVAERPTSDDPSQEAAIAFLLAGNLSRRLMMMDDEFLPPTAESLEAMDQLIMSGDQPASDFAGMTAIRHWLHAGGRLWIMLDQVNPETVALLLGDSFDYQEVDRVGLTELEILGTQSSSGEKYDPPRSLETPIEFVRVLVSDVDVTHTINGWPAAFWQEFGEGRVLFTTLAGNGWIRLRSESDPHPKDLSRTSNFIATKALASLTERFLDQTHSTPIQPEEFQPMMSELVGYQIIERRAVAFVLGTFCVGLLLVGSWLASRKRLDRLMWIGPLGSITTTVILVVIGAMPSQGVPNTLAVAQFVEVVPGSQDQRIQGLLAVYNRDTSSSEIGATRGGVFQSDMTGLEGETRRMVWTDLDTWHWENLSLPPGVRYAPFQSFVRSTKRIGAHGRFGPSGLTGTVLSGSFEALQDAIVATSAKESFAVRLDANGMFAVGPSDILAPGQFIAGRLLNNEQRRRQSIYRQMIPGPHIKKYPEKFTLLAWAKPMELQFSFPDQTKKIGTALLAIPLSIDPTPPETQVVIPSCFLPYRDDPGPDPDNVGSRQTFNNQSREWIERKGSTKTWLRFQLPPEVMPVQLEHSTLTVHINGPIEKLVIAGASEEKAVPIASRDKPVGTIRFPINTMDLLQPDASGGILLGVFVEVTPTAVTQSDEFDGGTNKWKIDYLRLEVSGTTLEP